MVTEGKKRVRKSPEERKREIIAAAGTRVGVGDLLKQRLLHMKDLMILIIISDVDSGTKNDLTVIRLHKTVDDL